MSNQNQTTPAPKSKKRLSRADRAELARHNEAAHGRGEPELTEEAWRERISERLDQEGRERAELVAKMDFEPKDTSGFLELCTNLLRLNRTDELFFEKFFDPSSVFSLGSAKIKDPLLRQILLISSFSSSSDRLKEVMLTEQERVANFMLSQGMLPRHQWARVRLACALGRAIQDKVPPHNFQQIASAIISPPFLHINEGHEILPLALGGAR